MTPVINVRFKIFFTQRFSFCIDNGKFFSRSRKTLHDWGETHVKKLFALLSILFVLVSCGHRKDANSFEDLLESATGDDFQIVKLNTLNAGYVVYQNQRTGEFVAYNLNKFDRKGDMTYAQYLAAADSNDVVVGLDHFSQVELDYIPHYETDVWYEWELVWDPYLDDYVWEEVRYEETYTWYEEVWVTRHYYEGSGFVFEIGTKEDSKDLEKIGGLIEQAQVNDIATQLEKSFGLSEGRAMKVGKMLKNFQDVTNKRGMTNEDLSLLGKEILGTDINKLKAAYKKSIEGEKEDMDKLIEQAAELNEIDPEHMSALMNQYLN